MTTQKKKILHLPASAASDTDRAETTPLALIYELIGCEWATTHFMDGRIIPQYTFNLPCVQEKSHPDQECRTCVHCRLMRVQTAHVHRYHHHGMVIPLTEEQGQGVLEALAQEGATPLERQSWKDHVQIQEQVRQEAEARHAQARSSEQQQTGPNGVIPIREA